MVGHFYLVFAVLTLTASMYFEIFILGDTDVCPSLNLESWNDHWSWTEQVIDH